MRPGRPHALIAALALIGLPLVLVPIEAIAFHAQNRSNGFIVSSGQTREYSLHVPASYDRARPAPLVISLHAAALWGAAQEDTSQWDALADREGFIVVYPTAMKAGGPRIWHAEAGPHLATDVAFISDLIGALRASYNIDPARIYANGLSNGGGMSFVLSCTLSDRIAAVGMVSAAQTLPWSWCRDSRPVPMITFHGTADPVVPYGGGRTWISPGAFPNIPAWTANWARRNRCSPVPIDAAVAANVVRRAYTGCADDADVQLYTLRGGGHNWPGGRQMLEWLCGPASDDVNATALMWAFFQAHPLVH
jgi:polyhydroxybutyrate depolymerase